MSGSVKTFQARMALQDHQALARRLTAVRQELQAATAVLVKAYGKSDVKCRYLERTLAALDLVRGHCSHALVHEHSERPVRELSAVYYPPEPNR